METIDNTPVGTFVDKQKALLALEHDEEASQHQQLLSTMTIPELESMGTCLSKLCITNVKSGLYGKILLSLAPRGYHKKELESNPSLKEHYDDKFSHHKFGPGDTIGLFELQDNSVPDLTSKPTMEGLIYQMKQHKVIIAVNDEPDDPNYSNKSYVLVLMTNEVTYKRYLHALDDLKRIVEDRGKATVHHCNHLINVLFQQDKPESLNPYLKKISDNPNKPIGDTIEQVFSQDKSINAEQTQAVTNCLKTEAIYLVHGPPGTGKTKTVCEYIHQCVMRKQKVLATAASNIAVDNMVERLLARGIKCCRIGHPARLLPTVVEACLDSMVYKDDYAKNLRDSKREMKDILNKMSKSKDKETKYGLRKQFQFMKKDLKSLEKSAIISTLGNVEVILATNTGAADKMLNQYIDSLPGKAIDVVVIDECAQALEVSCWIPLLKGRKAILAGDHQQLPPTIKSKDAETQGLSVTLFDRLMKVYGEKFSQLLRVQYRMNKQIMDWASNEVYSGRLLADASVAGHTLEDLRDTSGKVATAGEDVTVLTLIDTAGCYMQENVEEGMSERQSKFNVGESDLVLVLIKELKQIYASTLKNEDIGVITPYNAQVELIRKAIGKEDFGEGKIEVSTVDGFQGREKEIIIISMVRSNQKKNVGFLSDYRRMNVAVTRAKRYCALICDSETVKNDAFLKKLIEYFETKGEMRSASEFQGNKDVHFNVGGGLKGEQVGKAPAVKGEAAAKEKKKKAKNQNKNSKKGEEKPQQQQNDNKPEEGAQNHKQHGKKQEEQRFDYMETIKKFMQNQVQKVLNLPSELNSFERMTVHEFAEKNGLFHESVGEGDDRHIVLKKPGWNVEVKENQKKDLNFEVLDGADQDEEEKEEPEPAKKDDKPVEKKPQQAPPKPVQAQQPPKPKQKKQAKKASKLDNLNDDDFLDALIAQNKRCFYLINGIQPCTNNVEVLGIVCKFCEQKFCTKHVLAEIHGCGDRASEDAKIKFRAEFNLAYRPDSTLKPLRKDDEDMLRKKLAGKVNKATEERGAKQKKKGK
jgi:ATP-dependent RNA/DNA helicase IGHMBP2